MSCYKPLIRIYSPENREISGQVYSLARFSEKVGKKYRDWETRIELEARQWPKEQVWFITLTYDDDHVPGMITKTGEIMRKVQYVWKPGEKAPQRASF